MKDRSLGVNLIERLTHLPAPRWGRTNPKLEHPSFATTLEGIDIEISMFKDMYNLDYMEVKVDRVKYFETYDVRLYFNVWNEYRAQDTKRAEEAIRKILDGKQKERS